MACDFFGPVDLSAFEPSLSRSEYDAFNWPLAKLGSKNLPLLSPSGVTSGGTRMNDIGDRFQQGCVRASCISVSEDRAPGRGIKILAKSC